MGNSWVDYGGGMGGSVENNVGRRDGYTVENIARGGEMKI